jgi:2-oxoglutarate ferredoxin oxidoreductase subunit delta
MAYVTINAEGCKACLLCIAYCPRESLEVAETMNRRGVYPITQTAPERCTGCRICALMCPDVCIEVYKDDPPAAHTEKE